MIRFVHPLVLALLALIPLLAFLKGRRGATAALKYSTTGVLRALGVARRATSGRLLSALRLLVVGLVIVAAARPQVGHGSTEVEASGIDILLAVDVSSSMEALDFQVHDVPVSRIEVVKRVVSEFIGNRPNDRIGLVAFAGRPYMVSPMTLDHDWLTRRLETIETGKIEDGTAIGSAIASGVNRLRDQDAKSRIVILLTDGMNNAGKVAPATAAEAAQALGIKVYTIGAGTRGEAPVPVTDAFGRKRLAMAKVDIDEKILTEVADMTGARYFRATDTDSLRKIYEEIDRLETTTRKIRKFSHYRELYGFALFPALLLFGAEILLRRTRFRRLP